MLPFVLKEGTRGKCGYLQICLYVHKKLYEEKLIPFLICLGEGGNMRGTEQAGEAGDFSLYVCLFILFDLGSYEQITSLKVK